MISNIILIAIISLFIKSSESERILAIMPTPSYSHQIVFNPLWLELNRRGHHITLFTTDPIKNQNLTNFRQIDWSFAYDLWHEKHNVAEIIKNFNNNLIKCVFQYAEMMNDITQQELEHPEVQEIIKNQNEHFDLVIVECLYPAMIAFSKRFNCPFIGMSSMDITNFAHEALGNPTSPALYPDFISSFDSNMNFFERVVNTFLYLGSKLYFKYYLYPQADNILRKYLGEDTPKVEDIQKNASMFFLNINPVIHNVRPLMANVLAIGGGSHFDKNASLPADIQKFLDEAEHGAIYFSLGTNVKSKDLSEQLKQAFIQTFSELPYRVIWKFEDDFIHEHSQILIKKWLPQQQILKHPNIKLFVTQGGLQSLEETLYNAIPIVGIPAYVDQFSNVRRLTRKGLGVMLRFDEIEKNMLKETIHEVITNKRYKETAIELSSIFKEQPIHGLEQAVWWTEYILKYRGARFLKHSHIPRYQYMLLDVLGTLKAVVIIFTILARIVIKNAYCFIKEKRKDKSDKLE